MEDGNKEPLKRGKKNQMQKFAPLKTDDEVKL